MHAVVQLRGTVNMRASVEDTLGMLNLTRVNHCTFVPETPTYRGMVDKVNDYVAYGEPSQETVEELLRRRAEPVEGSGPVDDAWVEENTEYDDIGDLASALVNDRTTLRDAGLSSVLRLHPPRGGHDGIKHASVEAGELGAHSQADIDALLEAMR